MGEMLTRVLVVEDDPDFAESLVIALGLRHCEVVVAHSGEEAIRKFRDDRFDIAFMDIKLPGRSGVDCLVEIRQDCPDARVVMMTGFSEPALFDLARQAGAVDVLRKPFRMRELFSYVDALQHDRPMGSPPLAGQ